MRGKKNIIRYVVMVLVLAVLLIPSLNPLLDAGGKAALTAQLQATFGGLFGGTGSLTPSNLFCAAAIILLVWLVCDVLCAILNWTGERSRHSRSMVGLFISLIKFCCVILGGVWALSILGVNLTGIFASLGIASLIIGFGAQSLIEDAVTGIFIIFEGQYQVGDVIVLDDFRGVVKSIGIRTTIIEDTGYNLKIVNNSDIRNVQNRSKNSSIVVCDISIPYSANIEEVEKVIYAGIPGIYKRNSKIFLTPPRYAGVDQLGESSVVLRMVADVTEDNVFVGRRTLNREMKMLFDANNIEIPFNQLVIYNGDKSFS